MQEDKTICPHCGKKMSKWRTPPFSTWSSEFLYVCFNDECPYYVRGWKHMEGSMQHKCSYRHRYDPVAGTTGPLPVCSDDAGKMDIIEE
ncbi:ogr/Delta-like zinc finger family protein [Desulforhabdus amnigena]|uniref:Zinc finger Ogr/Delta-type domain-containing protein n=1 Tax=Desulforhabdus amnigena TaxID=40218 RepID=A0A9W6FWD3_9BACT|nr:ogr/Delta-like zinc finger family protein [Desulforhabdus amnigena]NLJ28288.1 ogr/Delta-like zinc finger family protein [Deltaproteobacteria bacterium]GLI36126.1 hypothetical protein DAMNIGENAA_35590 [Desulforhabdus amnigena]